MRHSRFLDLSFLALIGLILLSDSVARPTMAQTTFGAITGTVRDAGGAVVTGATIEATHVESNYKYTTRSNDEGNYTLPRLRDGKYRLVARAGGFQDFVVEDIQLASRDERRIDVTLQAGGVEASVEIIAGATLIETETPRVGDNKDADQLKSLPLNTRGLYNFLALSPGVVAAGEGFAFRRFAGSRRNQSDQSIDGISASTGQDGTQITPLVSFIESFQEVRVDMANNSADIGAIGQVTVISKGGTNELHGSLFDYYSTPVFRARDPFAPRRGTGVSHQPGGSVGGPIVIPKIYDGHDKSFFFFSFETSRGSNVLQLLNPTVPLAIWRQGCFPGVTVRDPFNRNQPFPNGCIPPERINSVSRRIMDRFWPSPNQVPLAATALTANNFVAQLSRPFNPSTYFVTRLDHRFSDKAFGFVRYTWNRQYAGREFEPLPTVGLIDRVRNSRAFTASFTYSISPTLVSEFRYGLAFSNDPRHGPLRGREIVDFLGLQGLVGDLPDRFGLPIIRFSGLGVTQISQTAERNPGFRNLIQQFQEHVNFYRGRHAIKAGLQISHYSSADFTEAANLFGNLQFSNRFTGHPFADFLLGIPTTVARAFPALPIDRVRWAYDFFITDDFKFSPNLTVNIGMRYELKPAFAERNGLASTFDIETGRIIVPDGSLGRVSPLLPRDFVQVVEARDAGFPGRTLIRTDRNNFAPRIGFAYRPWGNDTVIRGGYGIFYDVVTRGASFGGSPFVINEPSFTNPTNNPVVILPRVFPATPVGGPTTIAIPGAVRKDLRIPYSMQYSLSVEHQRWKTGFRLSYIGTNTRQGDYSYDINQPVADARLYVDKINERRFPGPTGTRFTTSATRPEVTIRPDILRDPNLPSSRRTARRWFDATAFTPPPIGRFGTSARGVILGPGNTVFHAGLAKHFYFGERMGLRLEMTGTNIFNHTNLGNPALNISNVATVGVIGETRSSDIGDLDQAGARTFRAGIRFEW